MNEVKRISEERTESPLQHSKEQMLGRTPLPVGLLSPEETATVFFLLVSPALAMVLGQLSLLLVLPAVLLHEVSHFAVARLLSTYSGCKLMPPIIYERPPGTWQCVVAGPVMSLLVVPIAVTHERPIHEILILTVIVLALASSDLEEIANRIRRTGW